MQIRWLKGRRLKLAKALRNSGSWLLGIVIWAAAISAGLHYLLRYDSTPGRAASPGSHWPAASMISQGSGEWSLVLVAHPKCPCTRASIEELNGIMAQGQGKLHAYVLFYKPRDAGANWTKTDLWDSAASIPGVAVIVDEAGTEAHRFDAVTSGQAILYDPQGRLRFLGGITDGRGHAGDNAGRDAIVSLVTKGSAARTRTSVFGCTIGGG